MSMMPVATWANTPKFDAPPGMTIEGTVVTDYEDQEGVTSVVIPDGVTKIGESAFMRSNITEITIPSTVEEIGKSAFSVSQLQTVTFEKSDTDTTALTTIGESAFSATQLTEIEIPHTVTTIGKKAFINNSNLATVTFVQSTDGKTALQTIGNYAFNGCEALTSITIPESVTSVGEYAFSGTNKLESITIEGNPELEKEAFSWAGSKLEDEALAVSMPNVTTIGERCFYACKTLTSIDIPKAQSIGSEAFDGTALQAITLPKSVTSMGVDVFMGVQTLENITVDLATLKAEKVNPNAFKGITLTGLRTLAVTLTGVNESVTLLDNGVYIGDKAFIPQLNTYNAPFRVTKVVAPTNGVIQNDTGVPVTVEQEDGQLVATVPNGGSCSVGAANATDANLKQLTVTANGKEVILTPAFSNSNVDMLYTANVDAEQVTLVAAPSAQGATVTVNDTAVQKEKDYTATVPLEIGENEVAITVTSPDEAVTKTVRLEITRPEQVPTHLKIGTADELRGFATAINNGKYLADSTKEMTVELTADIDLSGENWTPIGLNDTNYFAGTFEGNGHTITGLTMTPESATSAYGLFGYTAGTVQNVNVEGSYKDTAATANASAYIGGIAGYSFGEIYHCTADFEIAADSPIMGGIAGVSEGSVRHCTSKGKITDAQGTNAYYVGGVVGAVAAATVEHCVYEEGTINIEGSYTHLGGIVGMAEQGSNVRYCVNRGTVKFSSWVYNTWNGGITGKLSDSTVRGCTNIGAVHGGNFVGGIVGSTERYVDLSGPAPLIDNCLNRGSVGLGENSSGNNSACMGGIVGILSGEGEAMKHCIAQGEIAGATDMHGLAAAANSDATYENNYYDSSLSSSGDVPPDIGAAVAIDDMLTQDFIDRVNKAGGSYHLEKDADGRTIIAVGFKLVVKDSYATISGEGDYATDDVVNIDAGTRDGYRFSGWTTADGSTDGFGDASQAQTTFIMPQGGATIVAHWTANSSGPSGSLVDVADSDHGKVTVTPRRADKGATVTITVTPDEGYALGTLTVTDKNGNALDVTKKDDGTYTFTMPKGKVTVSATFVKEEVPVVMPFVDVPTDAWYHDAVYDAYTKGLMVGTDATHFSPLMTTSRGMIVTMLYRLAGEPSLEDEIFGYPYEDVDANAYYANAVYWARMNDIVSGYSADKFGPNDPITREQLAGMLMRFAVWQGDDVSARADLSAYSDADKVSGWAKDAVQWAVAEGYLAGTGDNTLSPQGQATRAQTAAVFTRVVDK